MNSLLCLCFLVLCASQGESLKIIEKLKGLFKPETSTTTVRPIVPDYEGEDNPKEKPLFTVYTTTPTDTSEEFGIGQVNTTEKDIHNSYSGNYQPSYPGSNSILHSTTEKGFLNSNSGNYEPSYPGSNSTLSSSTGKGSQNAYSDNYEPSYPGSSSTLSSATGKYSQNAYSDNYEPSYPGSSSTLSSATRKYSQNAYSDNYEPSFSGSSNNLTPTTEKNFHNSYSDTVEPFDKEFSVGTFTTNSYYNSEGKNTIQPSKPISNVPTYPGGPTSPSTSDLGGYNNERQPDQQPSVGAHTDVRDTIVSTTLSTDHYNYNQRPIDQQKITSPKPTAVQERPETNRPTYNNNRPLMQPDDNVIVYPDHPSLNTTEEPERIFDEYEKHKGGQVPASSKARSYGKGHVPVDDESGRRIINAPTKDCGPGKKLDDNGNCRTQARK